MAPTPEQTELGYHRMWDRAQIAAAKLEGARKIARAIIANRARYAAVEQATGVPWFMIGPIHARESDMDFSTHLHNGDSLKARTHHVPAGRPKRGNPPFQWDASAIDALTMAQFIEATRPFYQRILICIDELDKLESEEVVFRFMNEVKALFGIEKCFYLVSVSDAAISDFERRGLNFSNAFDSALDTTIHVPYFDREESRSLIDKRIAGLPQSFLGILEVISGGLPRDLIRAARELAAAKSNMSAQSPGTEPTLDKLVLRILRRDVSAKLFAIRTAVRTVGVEPATTDFLDIAQKFEVELDAAELSSGKLLEVCERLSKRLRQEDAASKDKEDREELRKLTGRMRELTTYLYLTATMMELFVEKLAEDSLRVWDTGDVIRKLMRARQDLRVQPGVAFFWISSVRKGIGIRQLRGWATVAEPSLGSKRGGGKLITRPVRHHRP